MIDRRNVDEQAQTASHYYVDEAGDLTLFDKKGRIIVGRENVSKYFMVGVACIPDPVYVGREVEKLRKALLADPYYTNVPSFKPENKKTAVCFHANKDLPEVRREIFKLLPTFNAKVIVAIRRKSILAENAQTSFKVFGQKLNTNQVYDDLVKRLFRNLLHKAGKNEITFARRGKSAREEALRRAIEKAQENFFVKMSIVSNQPTNITACYPSESTGLQVVDYYLWALQRLYEKGEDRFYQSVVKDYRLIMDLDDTKRKEYGEWYSDSNPLTRKKIKPELG